jgi:enterobacteria phage integrase
MVAINLQHVEKWKDRHGHWRYYYRRGKGKRTPLPGIPGSAEFMKAHADAVKAFGQPRSILRHPRSFDALLELYFRSPNFLRLKPSSQYCTRNVMERFAAEHGKGLVPEMTRTHVDKIIGAKAATPAAANTLLKRVRTLINYAIALEWRQTDPTKGLVKFSEGEYHTWTEDELKTFEKRWPIGTRERTAYSLALYTGQRRADVCRMKWTAISGGRVAVVQEKTGTVLSIPIHPDLAKALKSWPRSPLVIITNAWIKAYTVESFGNLMAKAIDKAGLPSRCVFHGLRKAAARRLAEAGCSASQIAAITGHKSLSEVERYTRAASQSQMADDAILKLPTARVGKIKNKQNETMGRLRRVGERSR